jgi:hypothetical protein
VNRNVAMHIKWWVLGSPVVFFTHDLEEFLTMPGWMARHPDIVPAALRSLVPANRTVLVVAFAIIFAVYAMWAILAVRASRRSVAVYIFALFVMARLTNAIMHIFVSAYLRGYSPGVVTAALVILPFTVVLVRKLVDAKWIEWPAVHVLFLGGIILQAAGTIGLLALAHTLAGLIH